MADWWSSYSDPAPAQSKWKSFVQTVSDATSNQSVMHGLDLIANHIGHGAASMAGNIGDALSVMGSAGTPIPDKEDPNHHLPNLSDFEPNSPNLKNTVTSQASKAYKDTFGDVQPKNTFEKYVAAGSEGVGGMLLPIGGELGLGKGAASVARLAASGAIQGASNQFLSDVDPDHPVLNQLGSLAAGGIPFAGPAITKLKGQNLILAGASHPDFENLWQGAVIPDEGGGTLEHPKVSPKSARGPAQIEPYTAKDPGYGVKPSNGTPEDDVRAGRQYFAAMLGKYGDPEKALAAYNAGPGRIDSLIKQHGDMWYDHAPKETQEYVAKGMTKVYGGPAVNPSSEAPIAPDGLPGNGSVSPIDPREIASIMSDHEAAGLPEQPQPVAEPETPSVPEASVPQQAPPSNVVDFGQARENSQADLARNFLDEKLNSAAAIEQRVMDGEDVMSPEDATKNREIADQLHNMLDENHAYRPRTAELQDIWRSIENTIKERQFQDNEVLTPAERQEMDASAQKPVVDNTGYEKHTPYVGEPKGPANDVQSSSDLELERHINTPDNLAEAKRVWDAAHEEAMNPHRQPDDYYSAVMKQKGQSGRKFHMSGDEFQGALDKADAAVQEFWDNKVAEARANGVGGGGEPPKEPPVGGGSGGVPPEDVSPIDKLRQALDKTAVLRQKQELGYSEERSARFKAASAAGQHTSGEAGFYEELSRLKGELPKESYEGLRDDLHQHEIDQLTDMVKNHPRFNLGQSLTARTGLMKILNGEVPTKGELRLLNDVFDPETMESIRAGRVQSLGDKLANVLSIPRSLLTLIDLAAPGRHALPLIGTKAWWTNIPKEFGAVFSEKYYQRSQNQIMSRPTYPLMKKSGLAMTNLGSTLADREEVFMSKILERVPGLGGLYRAGGRGYTTYLNRVRADTFDKMVKLAKAAGVDAKDHPDVAHNIAELVNNATGRADLGRFNAASRLLNSAFFAPRLRVARLQMMNPVFYAKLDPFTRMQAMKTMLTATAIVTTTLGLAGMAGYKVTADPRDPNFGKIKVGNTSIDVSGGYGTEMRTIAQISSGKYVNNKGKLASLDSGKFGAKTRYDVARSYVENSEAPVPGIATELLKGKDHAGRSLHTLPNNLGDRGIVADNMTPIAAQETMDAIHEYGAKGLLALPPSLLGFSARTYNPKDRKKAVK